MLSRTRHNSNNIAERAIRGPVVTRKNAGGSHNGNTARSGKLQQKRHALATRMKDREADYLRFARDLRVPFTNYPDAAVMPMFAGGGGSAAGQGGVLAA